MKFDELRDYLENKITLGEVTFPKESQEVGTKKKYQFIAILTLFQNNGKATKEQIKLKLKELSNYSGLPEVFTSIEKKKVARENNQNEYELIDFNEYSDKEKTVIINICEEKIQRTQSWVIKPGEQGKNWEQQLENGIIAIGVKNIDLSKFYDEKGDYLSGSNTEIVDEIKKNTPPKKISKKKNPANSLRGTIHQNQIQLHDVARIQVGDFIYAYDNKKFLGIGRVKGKYNFNPNEKFCHRYKVDWYDKKGRTLKAPKNFPGTIMLVHEYDIEWASGQGYPVNKKTLLSKPDPNLTRNQMEGNEMSSNSKLKELAKKTYMSELEIKKIENELNEQRQIIFTGPPGTGKTFFAREFAEYFTGNKDNIDIIQFHPSYNYEDFVEGIRPKIDEKKDVSGDEIKDVSGYVIKPGILKISNEKASKNEKSKIVLIIDEINRGNISRIFGELIYLLEYRQEKITLTYSSGFKLQNNLYIIGTMNTADRSIALMDYAIRRRFAFFEFKANYEILSKWMDGKGISKKIKNKVVSFMNEINNIIAQSPLGEECQIGQSYFMKENIDKTKLEKIFNYKILPLLKEYYFADKDQIKEIEIKFRSILENWNKDES